MLNSLRYIIKIFIHFSKKKWFFLLYVFFNVSDPNRWYCCYEMDAIVFQPILIPLQDLKTLVLRHRICFTWCLEKRSPFIYLFFVCSFFFKKNMNYAYTSVFLQYHNTIFSCWYNCFFDLSIHLCTDYSKACIFLYYKL